MINVFKFAHLPEIHFGPGSIRKSIQLIKKYGNNILLVTGRSSFSKSEWGNKFLKDIESSDIKYEIVGVDGEPTTLFIDKVVHMFRNKLPDVVVSVGGGSVLDAGKAVSAMIPVEGETWDYIEGNPEMKPHPGNKVPFIAIPTTSGTGSEATKNAVLLTTGDPVLKRSLRHENFVPDISIIDPALTLECPADVTAASGLDAITQLLEAYVSTQASAMTDALAYSGLEHGVRSIRRVVEDGNDLEGRSDLAYAALMSGIVLANAGLGVIHGFASVLGGYYGIPHGVICGTLLGAATRINIEKLRETGSIEEFTDKYARAGELFTADDNCKSKNICLMSLADGLDELIDDLQMPRLGKFGVKASHISSLAGETGVKNNPVDLDCNDLEKILESRL